MTHVKERLLNLIHVPARIGGNTSVHTTVLTNKQRKNTHKTITQFLCLIFKDILYWLTHEKISFKK